MVPECPVPQVTHPHIRAVGAGGINRRECVVERNVKRHRANEHADNVDDAADEGCDRSGLMPLEQGDDRKNQGGESAAQKQGHER